MSDIAGPPAPKDIQPSVRGTDKTAYVAKDPKNEDARTQDNPREHSARDQGETLQSREPAVSIAATAAHLTSGQDLVETVSHIDAEGRPIVVTDTVTLALKPDAGLKPNDEVHLKVIDADKQVTADLLRQNTQVIDPPVRLSVTVVEVHGLEPLPRDDHPNPLKTTELPYQAPKAVSPTSAVPPPAAGSQTDDVALLVGGKHLEPAIPTVSGTLDKEPSATPIVPPLISRASSADLSTLIQQQTAPPSNQGGTPDAKVSTPQVAPAVIFAAAEGPGVGPAINGVSLSGEPAIIQLLNPAVSRVSPAQIATVTAVQTLSAEEARALPIGASVLAASGTPTGELARVETNQGDFVLPAQPASALNGEIIRVAVGPAPAETTHAATGGTTSYGAILTPDTASPTPVKVTLTVSEPPSKADGSKAEPATITNVQTVAAFLSPDGPRTDLRLQTSTGTLAVTLPSSVKPQVGETVFISTLPPDVKAAGPETASSPAGIQSQPAPSDARAPAALSPELTAAAANTSHIPNILSSWPALEESLAALASANATATTGLVAKTAQGGGKLTNSLLFFLAAAGRAAPGAWLGAKTEQALAQSSPSALSRMRSDIRQMVSLSGETIGEWRPIVLPFDARGGEAPLAALLIGQRHDIDPDHERDNPNDPDTEKADNQRFILQVQFSVLGDIQLDGSIHRQMFDLTVRSSNSFSPQLKQEAEHLFYTSLAANNFAGTIDFQEQSIFPVDAASIIENHLLGH